MVKDSFMHVTFKRFRNDSMKKDLEITHTFFLCLILGRNDKRSKNIIKRKKKEPSGHPILLKMWKNYIYYRNILNFFST